MYNNSVVSKSRLTELYNSGHSMAEIAKTLNCSQNKIVYWMNKYQVKKRSRREATYVKRNPNGDPFLIKEDLTKEEMFLLGLGIGIYWGKGEKVSVNAIRVANTDPNIIKTFIKFLLEICQLERRKLSYSIVCFNDSDPDEAKIHWAEKLRISEEKFGRIVQIPTQGKGSYKRKSQFGVCTLAVSNPKLKSWIMEQIKKAWIV